MIPGTVYVLRGERVTALAAWCGRRDPDADRLAALLPHVRTKRTAPRNVLIRLPDGRVQVRPFRGLRRAPEGGAP